MLAFQSTPPRGGRRGDRRATARSWMFQSTPPRGGRRAIAVDDRGHESCFNPRPRVGGDAAGRCRSSMAPDVSIHAPAWGATDSPHDRGTVGGGFQSTPPRGGRRPRDRRYPRCDAVSIHAPAWGATIAAIDQSTCHDGFNPRPRVGGDLTSTATITRPAWFQSTPPRGGRRARSTRCRGRSQFQSTPPRGGRPRSPRRYAGHGMRFNPRPRVGGDRRCDSTVRAKLFQSTPPRGGRLAAMRTTIAASMFQSTPPRGGRRRRASAAIEQAAAVSIHAPAWGATAPSGRAACRTMRFNPRPRVGGDRRSALSATS